MERCNIKLKIESIIEQIEGEWLYCLHHVVSDKTELFFFQQYTPRLSSEIKIFDDFKFPNFFTHSPSFKIQPEFKIPP